MKILNSFRRNSLGVYGLLICGILINTASATAGPIIQAVSATATNTYPGFNVASSHNQSGLSSPYISGMTNFRTYAASAFTFCCNDPHDIWAAQFTPPSVALTYNLGNSIPIQSIALWNRGLANQGIRDFSLHASDDPVFTTSILLGNFVASAIVPMQYVHAQIFEFAPVSAQYFRLDIFSFYGDAGPSFSEIAFEQEGPTSIPEPENFLMFSLIALLLLKFRRCF